MQRLLCLLLLIWTLPHLSIAQTNCPGCSVSLPQLPKDTIFMGEAPNGISGIQYEGSISFRLPRTTSPVNAIDPKTPAGLPISKITIQSVANLPPGLSWSANQTTFNPNNQSDGCVKLCGNPLQPGYYDVQVFVTAEVLLLNQSTSFTFPIYIGPSVSENPGFSMVNNSGCGSVQVDFKNNIASQGKPGFSYFWDFGNGQTSSLEDPGPQFYSRPGVYEVNYQANVDTSGYTLAMIQITEAGCKDLNLPPIFNKAPDLYIRIKDPAGKLILQTNPIKNTPLPYSITLNLPLKDGNYSLEVRDNESIGTASCGLINFSKATSGLLTNGDLKVRLNIIHPVSSILTKDTVYVYPVPEKPVLSPSGRFNLCKGQEIILESSYKENIQWYKDSTLIFGAITPKFTVSQSGNYCVEYTSPYGCKVKSEPAALHFAELPARPIFNDIHNRLSLQDLSALPSQYQLQWHLDEVAITGATDTFYCNILKGTQLYGLQVTDISSGCSNSFSIGVTFNSDFICGVPLENRELKDSEITISPNPGKGPFNMEIEVEGILTYHLQILDPMGRRVTQRENLEARILANETLDLTDFPNGVYYLYITTQKERRVFKLLKL